MPLPRRQEAPKEGEPKGTSASLPRDTCLFWEFFNYGLRFPMPRFVDEVLVTLDRAPSQLMPFAWLVLTVFQVECLAVVVVSNIALFISFKAVSSRKDPLARISKRKVDSSLEVPATAPSPKKSKKAKKKSTLIIESSLLEVFSSLPLDHVTIVIPDRVASEEAQVSEIPPHSSTPEILSTYKGPLLEVPYSLPSGLTVTEDTIFGKILRRPLFYILGETAGRSYLGERRGRAHAHDLEGKYEDLQAVRDGLVKSKSDLSRHHEIDAAALKEFEQRSQDLRAQLDSSQRLLADSEKLLEQRPPPEVVIEQFKEGQNYKYLLIDDTVSIMKSFSLKVYPEFPGIHFMFPEFVGEHFGQEYVTDGEEESDDSDDAPSDDGLGKMRRVMVMVITPSLL
ncbi:hypothetical protein LIER_03990 [Lithospermum erythrorhizon]|uniref:Uncharacterized protein n=1 Tax=Lithospermum erythrorhizon TaxID=34254 RepID=A0AAV3NVA2_LITER